MQAQPNPYLSCVFSVVFLLLLSVAPQLSYAGPWTQPQGDYYLKVGESLYVADSYRNARGETVSGGQYLSATTFTYFQYGIAERVHVQGYIPAIIARNRVNESEVYSDIGFGDASLGVQVSPFDWALPFALRLDAKLPLYRGETQASNTPARGDGQIDLTGWASIGGSFSSIPLYLFTDVGYQFRSGWHWSHQEPPAYSDSIASFTQVGYWLLPNVLVAWNTSGVFALKRDFVTKTYLTTGPSLFIPFYKGLALEADGYVTPFSRNSGAGWSVGLGLSYSPQ